MTQKARRIALVGAECEENLALRYIRSTLENAGFTVVQIAFDHAEEVEEAAIGLASSDTELAGFSMVFTYRAREFVKLAERARELGYRGHMVAGGHFAAFNATELLRDVPAFDSVVVGEGENPMVELASNLSNPAAVRGLVWRDEQDRLVRNPPAEPLVDLDSLPHPVRKTPPDSYLGLPIANMLSSRGCTHSCHFCSIAAWRRTCGGPRFRARSPSHVAAEMASLYRQGYRLFNFHDDNFVLDSREANLARVTELRAALQEQKVGKIGFAIKARPDRIDERAFGTMRSMGLFRVFLGIEAGTDASLRNLGRRQTVSDNERALSALNDLDLHVCFNLLIFNPDSTIGDFLDNVSFLERHPHNPMNFCRTEVYAGTPLERKLREQGRLLGGYWGHGYLIADDHAQRTFKLTHDLLFGRHHGETNLHHLTMRVDYERQLLGDFFRCSRGLRDRCKEYVTRVNLATAVILRQVAAAAATPEDTWENSPGIRELRRAIERDTEVSTREGHTILSDIRREAATCGGRQRPRMSAAGLAASIALTTGVTTYAQGHFTEMVAEPTRMTPARQPSTAETTNQTSHAVRPPDGDIDQIRDIVYRILVKVSPYVDKVEDVDVELWIDVEGKISFVAVYRAGMASKTGETELVKEDREKADRLLRDLGDQKFSVREKATQELKGMGAKIVDVVRKYQAQSTDPEVQERCNVILRESDCFAKLTDAEKMSAAVKAMKLSVPEENRGKRYVARLDARQIEKYKVLRNRVMDAPHVFEMAPGPLD